MSALSPYPENEEIPATALAVLTDLAEAHDQPFIVSSLGFQ
jgi:hypothetical protein